MFNTGMVLITGILPVDFQLPQSAHQWKLVIEWEVTGIHFEDIKEEVYMWEIGSRRLGMGGGEQRLEGKSRDTNMLIFLPDRMAR